MFRTFTLSEVHDIALDLLKNVDKILREEKIWYTLTYGSVLGAIRHNGFVPWDGDVDMYVYYKDLDRVVAVLREKLPEKYYIDYFDINSKYSHFFPRISLTGYDSKNFHIDLFYLVGLPNDKKEQVKFFKQTQFYINLLNAKKRDYNTKYLQNIYSKFYKRAIFKFFLKHFMPEEKIKAKYKELCLKYPIEDAKYVNFPIEPDFRKSIIDKSYFENERICDFEDITLSIPEKSEEFMTFHYGDYKQYPSLKGRNLGFNSIVEGIPLDRKRVLFTYNEEKTFEENVFDIINLKNYDNLVFCLVPKKYKPFIQQLRCVDDVIEKDRYSQEELFKIYEF